MPRHMAYDVDVVVPAAVMYGYFTTVEYWEDLVGFYRENATRTEIAHFRSDDTGTDISFAHILSAEDLPAIARPVVPGTFVITREQHFEPFDEAANQATGRYRAQIPAPVDVTGDYVLADTEHGSRMRLETACRVRVPIIGGQIEGLLVTGLKTLFSREGEFTADWVAGHR
ncbi:MAG: DUF2505 domain-containing protein [Mycobacterium sp.]|nr:DUF2505 domain-containing protein [Mycobacterium sp.]